jgi:putative CocE/NonD family hydrolase
MLEYTEYHYQNDVMVPMRDGVCLATDVYLPMQSGKAIDTALPVVLIRTPYDKTRLADHASIVRLREFAFHGYAVVAQDCRGRHNSEGEFYPFVNETNDGHNTLNWLGEQPWCNGRIGTTMTQNAVRT